MEEIGDLRRNYEGCEGLESILSREDSGCRLTKLMLDRGEAAMLLHKLIKLGYDAGRLFPTYEGAARAVKESMDAKIGPRW
jgi:hypothetical protein